MSTVKKNNLKTWSDCQINAVFWEIVVADSNHDVRILTLSWEVLLFCARTVAMEHDITVWEQSLPASASAICICHCNALAGS